MHSRSLGCRYRSGHMPVLGVRSADQAGHWREHFGAHAAVEKMQGPVEKIEPAKMTPQLRQESTLSAGAAMTDEARP
jgi:hypothetical protein